MDSYQHGPPSPEGITGRLASIGPGLTEDVVYAAVRAGRYARNRATALHPPLTGPFNAHAEATYTLRARLASAGWRPCNRGGYPRTVTEDLTVGIAIAAGDEHTGVAAGCPTTSAKKGTCTEKAVLANQGLLYDFLGPEDRKQWEVAGSTVAPRDEKTWILLIHEGANETRIELSLPSAYDEKSERPVAWSDRIILPPLLHDEEDDFGMDDGVDVDVPVTRRTG